MSNKYGVPRRLDNGKPNPEYGRRWRVTNYIVHSHVPTPLGKLGVRARLPNGRHNPEYRRLAYQVNYEREAEGWRKWKAEHPDYHRNWSQAHRQQENERVRNWRKLHPENARQAVRKSYRKHRAKRLLYNATWREANREAFKLTQERWRKTHPEKVLEKERRRAKKYPNRKRDWGRAHPEKQRMLWSRHTHKRRRGFTTNTILGRYFPKAHLHHMTPDLGVYIPEELHKSVRHNIWTGEGMEEINWKAWVFHLEGFSF